jgi:hypothetical protein
VGGEVDVERRHDASPVLGVAAYGVVRTGGLGVGVVKLADSVRGVHQRGRQGHRRGRRARIDLPGKTSRGWVGPVEGEKREGGRGYQVGPAAERGNQLTGGPGREK